MKSGLVSEDCPVCSCEKKDAGPDCTRPTCKIELSSDYFEHLLNCLANQKFIKDMLPEEQKKNQEVIDKAWFKGMFILNLDIIKKQNNKTLLQRYKEIWDSQLDNINKLMEEDKKDFPNDDNIDFKWCHLLNQEIWMWIDICSNFDAIIDLETSLYKIGQVKKDEFEDIIIMRGFTPRMINILKITLVHIGIGNEL